jgi:hypothetical protein
MSLHRLVDLLKGTAPLHFLMWANRQLHSRAQLCMDQVMRRRAMEAMLRQQTYQLSQHISTQMMICTLMNTVCCQQQPRAI